jgi:hypothetical protein
VGLAIATFSAHTADADGYWTRPNGEFASPIEPGARFVPAKNSKMTNSKRNCIPAMLRKALTTLTLAVATLTALCSCNFNNSDPNGTSQKLTIEADKVLTHTVCGAVNESALNDVFAAVNKIAQGKKITESGENGQDLVQAGQNSLQTGLSTGSLIKIATGQTVTVHAIANLPDIPDLKNTWKGTWVAKITYQGKDYLIFCSPNTFK